jgi:hypothetical protein
MSEITIETANEIASLRRLNDAKIKWRCFHCGGVFESDNEAAEHFGLDYAVPATCIIEGLITAAQHGGTRSQLRAAFREVFQTTRSGAWAARQAQQLNSECEAEIERLHGKSV